MRQGKYNAEKKTLKLNIRNGHFCNLQEKLITKVFLLSHWHISLLLCLSPHSKMLSSCILAGVYALDSTRTQEKYLILSLSKYNYLQRYDSANMHSSSAVLCRAVSGKDFSLAIVKSNKKSFHRAGPKSFPLKEHFLSLFQVFPLRP